MRMNKEKILLKFGGSLITDKKSNVPIISKKSLTKIGNLLNNERYDLIIVHGAGSFGHPIAKNYNLSKGLNNDKKQLHGIKKARKQLKELNSKFCRKLTKIETVAVAPSKFMKTNGSNIIENFPKEIFDEIIKNQKVPITFGDVTADISQGINILSGDIIMKYLAEIYKPKYAIFVMDLPGILDGDPFDSKSRIIPILNSEKLEILRDKLLSTENDVTGGILAKAESAIYISNYSETWITNINSLEKCLEGKPTGTRVII